MLVLTRRTRESLMIGDTVTVTVIATVTVTVIAVKGMPVCIGIKTPDDVTVDRKEISERKRCERKSGVVAFANRCP